MVERLKFVKISLLRRLSPSLCFFAFSLFVAMLSSHLQAQEAEYCSWQNGCPSDKCQSGPTVECDPAGGSSSIQGCSLRPVQNPQCHWKSPLKEKYREITLNQARDCLDRFKKNNALEYPLIQHFVTIVEAPSPFQCSTSPPGDRDAKQYGENKFCWDFFLRAPGEISRPLDNRGGSNGNGTNPNVKVGANDCAVYWDLTASPIYKYTYPSPPQMKINFSLDQMKACAEDYIKQHLQESEAFKEHKPGSLVVYESTPDNNSSSPNRHSLSRGVDWSKDYYSYLFVSGRIALDVGASTCSVYDYGKTSR